MQSLFLIEGRDQTEILQAGQGIT